MKFSDFLEVSYKWQFSISVHGWMVRSKVRLAELGKLYPMVSSSNPANGSPSSVLCRRAFCYFFSCFFHFLFFFSSTFSLHYMLPSTAITIHTLGSQNLRFLSLFSVVWTKNELCSPVLRHTQLLASNARSSPSIKRFRANDEFEAFDFVDYGFGN